jgi:soluble lytic murein transglycosylase-like protein
MKFVSSLICLLAPFNSLATCWESVGDKYKIEPELLQAIAKVESGMNPVAINKNRNGTYDIGIMQINSYHFPALEKRGVTEHQLKNDVCLSISVGASILSEMINIYGYNWEAVGAYNAGLSANKKQLRMKYARNVWGVYHELKIKNNKFYLNPAKIE